MPPNLHPRSSHTTTLFSATLAVSFLVVGLPHILPCPVPTRQHLDATTVEEVTDENGRRVYRRVYKKPRAMERPRDGEETATSEGFGTADSKDRECPVPKPTGVVGRLLGFDGQRRTKEGRAEVVIRREKGGEERG